MTLTTIKKAGLDDIALDHVFTIGASGSSAYTFQGEGLNGTVNNPTLYLTRGKTYRFENGSGGHPIRIQSTSGASGTAYNTGVTNNAGSGTVIVEVQHDAPDVLYYQCTSHANMNGVLYITGALADGGVTTDKLAAGAVTNPKLASSAVGAGNLQTNAVETAKIQNGAVTQAKIANNAVSGAQMANGAVDTTQLSDNAVRTAKINDANVTTSKLADNAVTTAKIADDAVTNAKIAAGAVGGTQLGNNAVTAAKIGSSEVGSAALAANAVGTSKIADNAVTTAKIPDDAITNAKLADNSVNSNNYVDGSINTAHIADGNVTNAKLASNSVGTNKIASGAVGSGEIASGSIVNSNISSSAAISGTKISPDFGSQNVTTTGTIESGSELKVTGTDPRLTFTDTDNNPDFQVWANAQRFSVYDNTNNATRVRINSSGHVGIGTESPSTTLSVVNDSNTEGFNVKHSNLSQGIGIGYDHIKSTGSSANVPLYIRSKGEGDVYIGRDSTNVISIKNPERNFKIHGNHAGWSTLNMDDQNYGWRKHVRRINNGTNAVTTHNIARIKRTNWGWGYFELRIYSTYYYGSYVSIGYVMGHGNGGDSFSIRRKKEIWTDNNSIGWGAEITKTSASSSSPGQSNAHYFDLQCTLPNYTYAVAEFIAYSSFKMSDSDMSGTLDCYRLHTP